MIFVSTLFVTLGLINVFLKKNLFSVLFGVQLLFLGVVTILFFGGKDGNIQDAQVISFLFLCFALVVMMLGHAFVIRLLFLNKSADLKFLRKLKH